MRGRAGPELRDHLCLSSTENLQRPAIKVFVATSVMLTFISFWRAAAIVLSDLASSAYYVGGDAEKVIGKSAPWFVLAVMLFSYAVRAIYIESSCDVRARRRLSRSQAGDGRDAGQALGLRAAVRLHSDRPHQLRRRRPVRRRIPHRHVPPYRLQHHRSRQQLCRSLRHAGDALLLVARTPRESTSPANGRCRS